MDHANRFLFCLLAVLILFPPGCAPVILQIPVQGELAGHQIETTVDSRSARYYLEHYLRHDLQDAELHRRIDRLVKPGDESWLTREYLQELSEAFSPDFAALYLAIRLLETPVNRSMQDAFREEFLQLKRALGESTVRSPHASASYVLLFAPGWRYRDHPESGADFARPREVLAQIGLETHLIETDQLGTVENNATIIAREIQRRAGLGEEIILVSASKAGPEVALALGDLLPPEPARQVRAWINIGGVLQGTPLADSALRWPRRWLVKLYYAIRGWSVSSIRSLTTKASRDRFRRLTLPEHILVVNYIGVPLSGQVTKRARKGYRSLRDLGPNDGLTLLVDEIAPSGITIVGLGLDHYYRDPDMDLKSVALTATVMACLESAACLEAVLGD